MNAPTFNGVARAASIALVVVLAAGAGLAVGSLIQQINGEESITARASFSRDALDDLNAIRAEAPAAAAYPDYGIRHAPATTAYPDWGIRHPTSVAMQLSDTFRLTGPSDVDAPLETAPLTDTFRLTGPSETGVQVRRQR